MSLNCDFYSKMSSEDKEIFEDYCKTLNLDIDNIHSYALFYEFKKSGLTW